MLRLAASEALLDSRGFVAVYLFDPRFFDAPPYGRATDPRFENSISRWRPIVFAGRKCCPLRARFILQSIRGLLEGLAAHGVELRVCRGFREEVFGAVPLGFTGVPAGACLVGVHRRRVGCGCGPGEGRRHGRPREERHELVPPWRLALQAPGGAASQQLH